MPIYKDYNKLPLARSLRREMTPHERKLWYTFLRQYPVKIYKQRIIHSYIVDFYCASARLVIELDGSQHFTPESMEYDRLRSAVFERNGLMVLRFTNHQIDHEFESVCRYIDIIIQQRKA